MKNHANARNTTTSVQRPRTSTVHGEQTRIHDFVTGRAQSQTTQRQQSGSGAQARNTEGVQLYGEQEETETIEMEEGNETSECSWPGALRRQGSDSSYCTSLSNSDDAPIAESPSPAGSTQEENIASPRNTQHKRKRPGLVKLYNNAAENAMEKNRTRLRQSDFIDSGNTGTDRIDPYDPATEKMYGAPPGGRVFRFDEGNNEQGNPRRALRWLLAWNNPYYATQLLHVALWLLNLWIESRNADWVVICPRL